MSALPPPDPLLSVRGLEAWYGKSHILQGMDLDVGAGEIVALIGRNGAGRSTTCKAIMGQLDVRGSVLFRGAQMVGRPPARIAQAGLGYVPENRDIFPGLTTRQNLALGLKPGQRDGQGRWSTSDMFDLFENLAVRADVEATALSGGEQQMLTICRTLIGDPDLIMVDEPTEGLSPQMTQRVRHLLLTIATRGVAILLVEQKLAMALEISQRVYVVGQGRAVFSGTPADLAQRSDVRREWIEI